MSRHANIPIFIPHEGCPNDCVFCNQRKITGTSNGADRDIKPEIEAALSTLPPDAEAEIAFFGGSFTGIERSVMLKLLKTASEYIAAGKVTSIRLSTRPDYISEEILELLSRHGVRHIELGIQSASDEVLRACKRGHTFEQTRRACKLITKNGFVLGGQMMIGLPGSTLKSELLTAEAICSLGASEARIYPTVVFKETQLCEMAKSGDYLPLSCDEAVRRSAECLKIFIKNKINVLRIGLMSSEALSSPDEVFAGANHPALGELCESAVYLDLILQGLEGQNELDGLEIICPSGELSKVVGHKKENIKRLSELLSAKGRSNVKITVRQADESMEKYTLRLLPKTVTKQLL